MNPHRYADIGYSKIKKYIIVTAKENKNFKQIKASTQLLRNYDAIRHD